MAGITTAMLASFKRDLFNGAHNFQQTRSFTCSSTTTATVGGISPSNVTATPIYRGAAVSGANIPANTVVAQILGTNSILLSQAPTAAITAFTVTGDIFNMMLFRAVVTSNWGAANTGYAEIAATGDETSGLGYANGGVALTNVDPVASSPSAYTTFSPNPTWTSATFSTSGCMIYNTKRNGTIVTPGVSVHDFGGTQTVSSGTFTVIMPTAAVGTAVLQIT